MPSRVLIQWLSTTKCPMISRKVFCLLPTTPRKLIAWTLGLTGLLLSVLRVQFRSSPICWDVEHDSSMPILIWIRNWNRSLTCNHNSCWMTCWWKTLTNKPSRRASWCPRCFENKCCVYCTSLRITGTKLVFAEFRSVSGGRASKMTCLLLWNPAMRKTAIK